MNYRIIWSIFGCFCVFCGFAYAQDVVTGIPALSGGYLDLLVGKGTAGTLMAYFIVMVVKKWVPVKWRAACAALLGLVLYTAYNALTNQVPLPDAIATGLQGGLAATGLHEIISKNLQNPKQ